MFEVLVTTNGMTFPASINNNRFGTVDLAHAKVIATYNNNGKSGTVISDGKNIALNPDLVVMRGTRVVKSLGANELPTEGFWGIKDGGWDLVDAPKPKAEPTETNNSDAPEDTF